MLNLFDYVDGLAPVDPISSHLLYMSRLWLLNLVSRFRSSSLKAISRL